MRPLDVRRAAHVDYASGAFAGLASMRREEEVEIAMAGEQHPRFHKETAHLAAPFGSNWFGIFAENIARFFGTPTYLIGQSAIVVFVDGGQCDRGAAGAVGPISIHPAQPRVQPAGGVRRAARPAAQTRQAERDKA